MEITLKQRRFIRSVLYPDMLPHIFTKLETMLPSVMKGLLEKAKERKK